MMDERKTPPAQAAPGRQWHDNDLPYMAVSKRWLEWTGARWIRAGLSDKSAYARARETRKKERERKMLFSPRAQSDMSENLTFLTNGPCLSG